VIDIPLNAEVECADGPCGESVTVIVDPTTQTVTHFVIQDQTFPHPVPRLVPFDQVAETTSSLIRLRCTKDELGEMEAFVETQYIKSQDVEFEYTKDYNVYLMPYVTAMETVYTHVEVDHIPAGELAVRRGTLVEATDGYVAKVGELLVNPDSGQITHLLLQEGHLWEKREIMLPLSAIDHVFEKTVYLKLDKRAVEALPAIPVRRHYGRKAAGKEIELLARVFDNPDQAGEALEFLKDVQRKQGDGLKIVNAAVLVKDVDGEVSLKETGDLDARQGRLFGAITGGLIGLLAGPAGAVIGALAGAGAGGFAAKRIDMGLSDEFLSSFQEQLQPGGSALVVLVEHKWAQSLSDVLGGLEGVTVQQTLTDEMVQQIIDAGEIEE
jgi:uncharacterized membrane protein